MDLEHDHSVDGIGKRLALGHRPSYVQDWVLGGIDGAVTTFAIVSGVVGAQLATGIILVLGLANLLADGFSMAAGNYSGTKSETDEVDRLREMERRHIALVPEGEREEIRQILAAKGLEGQVLEDAVAAITSNEETWIDTMLTEEFGVAATQRDPMTAAWSTFAAFVLCGAVPLVPFLLQFVMPVDQPFLYAIAATGVAFFGIGAAKSRWSLAPWWVSGLETLAIGMAAAGVAYGIGWLLKGLA